MARGAPAPRAPPLFHSISHGLYLFPTIGLFFAFEIHFPLLLNQHFPMIGDFHFALTVLTNFVIGAITDVITSLKEECD